jgi:hypothetical protein
MADLSMENPYWKAETKRHYLDREAARIKCFDVLNIMLASASLGDRHEMMEPEEDIEPSAMFRLHHRLAEQRLSQLLLEIAVFVRTFDDLMSSVAPEAYKNFSVKTDGANFIGVLDGNGNLKLREACNKIIHATDFRPVYERVDRELADGTIQHVWHLDGQIEIEGTLGGKHWEAVLYVENFLEIVLNRLEFEPPRTRRSKPKQVRK